jgi:hypothetical protein
MLFFVKIFKLNKSIFKVVSTLPYQLHTTTPINVLETHILKASQKNKLKSSFLKKSMMIFKSKGLKTFKFIKGANFFFLINSFVVLFLENFFKSNIIFNLKKGSNKLLLKQISFRKFTIKYFKRNLKTSKQIIGIIYYTLLLKDSRMFVNFFKKILEKINIKLHKKLFLGLKKLLKDVFKPIFVFLGVLGVFFNIKGKIGVSGSAKKRRYFFYFGKHSITTRNIKMDLNFTPI